MRLIQELVPAEFPVEGRRNQYLRETKDHSKATKKKTSVERTKDLSAWASGIAKQGRILSLSSLVGELVVELALHRESHLF